MAADLLELLAAHPLPDPGGGKEAKGNLVVVGGAPSCPGSAILAGRAALRCGAGRVQLVVHPAVTASVGAAFPEALVLGWDPRSDDMPQMVHDQMAKAAAVVVGPGLEDEATDAAVAVSERLAGAVLIVDALAIPALTDPAVERVERRMAAPNPKEACRLLGQELDDEPDVGSLAAAISKLLGSPTAVRGAETVIDDGEGHQWVQRSPTPGLGTPGSGDVVIGALGGLLSRGASPLVAVGWAVAAHARAGARLAEKNQVGFLAGEIADSLPEALRSLRSA